MALDYKSGLSRYRRYLQVVRDQPLIRAGIWTVLSLVLVITMIIVALKPTLVVIANLLGQIRQNKEIIVKLNDKILKIQQATSEMDKISSRLTVLDQALPPTTNWDVWTEEITKIASQSGVSMLTINIGPVAITGKGEITDEEFSIPGVSNVSFSVSATGTFDQLKLLVNSIENTRRLNILSYVNFTSAMDEEGGSNLTVYINGVATYAPILKN